MVSKLDGKGVGYILWERDFRVYICGIMHILKHYKINKWKCKWKLNKNLSEND